MLKGKYYIEQHNARQNSTRQTFIVMNNFLSYTMFGGQKAISVFQTICTWDKMFCCGLVMDKNISFCLATCPLSMEQFHNQTLYNCSSPFQQIKCTHLQCCVSVGRRHIFNLNCLCYISIQNFSSTPHSDLFN